MGHLPHQWEKLPHQCSELAHQKLCLTIVIFSAVHFSAKRGIAIACRLSVRPSVCPSVTLVDQDHSGRKSSELIALTLSLTPSLFVAPRPSTYSQGNIGNFGETRGGWEKVVWSVLEHKSDDISETGIQIEETLLWGPIGTY